MTETPLLSLLTFTPLVGAMLVVGLGQDHARLSKKLAIGFSALAALMAAVLWWSFDPHSASLQFVERHDWIPSIAVQYFLGLDGLGLLMVLLTALIVPMAMLAAWRLTDRAPLFFALVLFLEAGLFGTFTALNFFHWFLFWELALIPAFFLVKLWGGPERGPAATQFFIYTMLGSVALLLAFLAIYFASGTFDFIELAAKARSGELVNALSTNLSFPGLKGGQIALVIFAMALLGFAVKVPLMPFHTWLP
ncbi:MAG: NADH-quinone oxidoreductase subunit M, partial [Verrucomicrobia bacterium]|nr:NADH-quinone oxidoreductase subunit M [Verrucomicrobiota bacterium]